MKTAHLLCCACLAAAHAARAADEKPDKMLVVPPAETRDAGEATDTASAAEAPPAPDAPSAAPEDEAQEAPAENADVTPPPFPLSRYAPLWERSPFQLESIAPPAESLGLAQKFALTGIAQINGEPIVFLLERATQIRHMLDKKTNTAGLSLVQVDMQQKYADSTAVVRQGAEVGVVKFDPTSPAGGMAPPAIGQPQVRGPRAIQPGVPQPAIPGQPQNPGAFPGSAPGMPFNPAQGSQPQNVPGMTAAPGLVPAVPGPVPNAENPTQAQQTPSDQNAPPRVIRRRALIPAAP